METCSTRLKRKIKRTLKKLYLYVTTDKLTRDIETFSINSNFDTRNIDKKIMKYVDRKIKNLTVAKTITNSTNIAILATELYDMGGHTELVKNLNELLFEEYNIVTFLVRKNKSYNLAPNKIKKIEKTSKVLGLENGTFRNRKDIKNLLIQITEYNPKVLFSFQHMDDPVAAAVLYLLKKHTDVKIIYCNHGSHFAALGFTFADLIWECLPTTHYVTKYLRGFDKCMCLGLPDQKKEDVVYNSQEETKSIRNELGIKKDNYCTLSGASSYKLFEKDGSSKYFEMIKYILEQEKNLQHVVITRLSEKQKKGVENIFANSQARDRLIITDFKANYPLYFQACDVFTDSFPVSSALAQLELMKWKIPTVVKINRENAMFSFHEYFDKNYPYMFENIADMQEGILELLRNPSEQEKAIDINYNHYLNHYEGNVFKNKIIKLIENSNNLEQFYDMLDKNLTYKLELK